MKEEIYISTDVEADGPIPGLYSMLSFASAAFSKNKEIISTFTRNLNLLEGASPDPDTEEWWKSQPEAWAKCRENCVPPHQAMSEYVQWLKSLPGKPIFVGYPVAYDFMFIYWYLVKFTGEKPFSHSGIDIKTYSMALLKTQYESSSKKYMPKEWFDDLPHTHVALDDAIAQGALFCNMLSFNESV